LGITLLRLFGIFAPCGVYFSLRPCILWFGVISCGVKSNDHQINLRLLVIVIEGKGLKMLVRREGASWGGKEGGGWLFAQMTLS
jgi:hypothetical protein